MGTHAWERESTPQARVHICCAVQIPAMSADWRVRLQAEQLEQVLEAQRAFERRKASLMEELARKVRPPGGR